MMAFTRVLSLSMLISVRAKGSVIVWHLSHGLYRGELHQDKSLSTRCDSVLGVDRQCRGAEWTEVGSAIGVQSRAAE